GLSRVAFHDDLIATFREPPNGIRDERHAPLAGRGLSHDADPHGTRKSLARNSRGRLRDELEQARANLGGDPLDALAVERFGERDDEALDPDLPVRGDPLRDLLGAADERFGWRGHAVAFGDALENLLRVGGVLAHDDPLPAERKDLARVASHLPAVLAEDLDLVRDLRRRPESMPHVGVPRRGAELPLPAAATDQDRQSLLDRTDPHLGVHEVVVLPRERDALPIDELAYDLRSLREPGRPLPWRPEVDAVGVVLERVPSRADFRGSRVRPRCC